MNILRVQYSLGDVEMTMWSGGGEAEMNLWREADEKEVNETLEYTPETLEYTPAYYIWNLIKFSWPEMIYKYIFSCSLHFLFLLFSLVLHILQIIFAPSYPNCNLIKRKTR